MRAALLKSPRKIEVAEVPDPQPPEGWVRLRVRRVGICGTDKAMYLGKYPPRKLPLIPGHEIYGVVEELSDQVSEEWRDKRVTTEINVTCGKCWYCRHGMRTHCPRREALGISMDGGMAEFLITPAENLHSVDGLSDIQAAFVEPLAAIVEMVKQAPPEGDNFLVLGAGTIGLLSAQLLSLRGNVSVVARKGSPKAKLVESLGLNFVSLDSLRKFTESNTPEGQGFDYVVEATGSPEGLSIAMKSVRPRGTIAAKSTHGLPVELDYTSLVVREIRLIGSRCGPFKDSIKLLREGKIEVKSLVTSQYPLKDAKEAFETSLRRDQVKVHILPCLT